MSNDIDILDKKILASDRRRFISSILDFFFAFASIFISGIIVVVIGNIFNWDIFSVWEILIIDYTCLSFLFFLIVNYLIMESLFGKSIGKFLTGTTVVNKKGVKPGFGVIFIRTLSRLIPFDVFSFLGKSGRIWHDSISNTYVVYETALEEAKSFNELNLIGNNELN